MPFTNFPFGLTSFGIPLLGDNVSIPSGQPSVATAGGNVWFVDAGNSGGPHDGTSPTSAFQTIQSAVNAAASGKGDTIFIFPGTYTENVNVTKDYLSFIGAQFAGYAKPDIGPATGVALTVKAQGFRAKHCRFFATDNSDVVIQTGNGFEYSDCFFDGNGTQTTKCLFRLLPSNTLTGQTASEGKIHDCYFRGCGGSAGALIMDTSNLNGGSTDNKIYNNIFTQNTGVDIATAKTGAAGTYSVQFTNIYGNQFVDKIKATYIDITTNEDGAAANQKGSINANYFANDSAPMTTTQIKMVGTAFTFSGNFNTSGVVVGSALD
jgi:hypothetical protein